VFAILFVHSLSRCRTLSDVPFALSVTARTDWLFSCVMHFIIHRTDNYDGTRVRFHFIDAYYYALSAICNNVDSGLLLYHTINMF
jgi:hypothetical protein